MPTTKHSRRIYRPCVCCGILIEKPFYLCQSCEHAYGVQDVPAAEYPAWLKYLCAEARKDERREAREAQQVVSLDEMIEMGIEPRGKWFF